MPADELATRHTSDEVCNVMGELMNQILGKFIATVSQDLQTSINQSQPKMLTVNQQLIISIEANLDNPVSRRVSFRTAKGNVFYLEFSIDETEFIQIKSFESSDDDFDPDTLIEQHQASIKQASTKQVKPIDDPLDNLDLLDELGI